MCLMTQGVLKCKNAWQCCWCSALQSWVWVSFTFAVQEMHNIVHERAIAVCLAATMNALLVVFSLKRKSQKFEGVMSQSLFRHTGMVI